MTRRHAHLGLLVARVFAAVASVCGLGLVFLGAVLLKTHAAGGAGVVLIAGLVLAAMGPFIWCGSWWAMIATFAVSALAGLLIVAADPKALWIGLPIPAVFGLLTVAALAAGTRPANDSSLRGAGMAAELYAAAVYLGSFILAILMPTRIEGQVTRGLDDDVFLFGIFFAAMAVVIWHGLRWAMIVAFAATLVLALMIYENSPTLWWIGLPFPVVFGTLAAAALLAGVSDTGHPGGRIACEVYAAIVYLMGFVVVFHGPDNPSPAVASYLGAPRNEFYVLILALVLVALSLMIWRGRIWAMIAAFALALAHWLVLAGLDPSFWWRVPYWSAPLIFGVLTVASIAVSLQGKTRLTRRA